MSLAGLLATLLLVVAAAGCAYLVLAAVLVGRLAPPPPPFGAPAPAVSVLKPLHGAEPGLFDNLASVCRQSYGGEVQLVMGLRSPDDPAAATARRLIAAFPERDIVLVIDPAEHGGNRKVSNLVNMAAWARHPVLVLADSDIRVGPDYLAAVVDALMQPGVGAVTCLYHGEPAAGLWSRLGALAVDAHFLPNVVVGLRFGLARPCFGSTIALRRETLAAIGGLAAFADRLADDYAIGDAVRASGLAVALPPFTVGHVFAETSLAELWRHEVRWARTIRVVDPRGHRGAIVTHPFPLALLALAAGGGWPAVGLAAVALACRIGLCMRVERAFGLARRPYWLLPGRDLLAFTVYAASLFGAAVRWRGQDLRVRPDGALG